MDCDDSKRNGTVFGMHDWPDSMRGQAAMYRKLAEQTDDPFVKNELLDLAAVCEAVANNIEDHLTDGEDDAGRPGHPSRHWRGLPVNFPIKTGAIYWAFSLAQAWKIL
jgi:hypothetical protein